MKRIFIAASVCIVVMTIASCAGSLRGSPHTGFQGINIEANMERDDFIILDRVEGESDTTSIFLGIVQIIDSEKLKLFWIPFYQERYAYQPMGLWGGSGAMCGATEKRAYYKALAETPDADCVLYKSYVTERSGVPLIFTKKKVTFSGKALQLKADK